jgi:hypothetical protein
VSQGFQELCIALRPATGLWLLPIAIVFSIGCASPRVDTDWDPSINWPALTHYAWLPDPPGHAGDPRLHNDLIDGRVNPRPAPHPGLAWHHVVASPPQPRPTVFAATRLGGVALVPAPPAVGMGMGDDAMSDVVDMMQPTAAISGG